MWLITTMFSSLLVLAALIAGALGYDGCQSIEFSCNDGTGACIAKNRWCDGVYDCRNRFDENYCRLRKNSTHHIPCPQGMLACELYSGDGCLPAKGRCDGYNSCKDGLDERGCQPVSSSRPAAPAYIPDNVEDFDHDFEEDQTDYTSEQKNALDWVLKQRKDYKWAGDSDTERAIVALSFYKKGSFESLESEKEEKLQIMSLHLRISLALRNWNKISTSHRALFIHALTASCGNARNFYGSNLVADLRGSVNALHRSHHDSVAPIVYLTLCLTNMSTTEDIEKISGLASNSKNDLKALFLLTIVCMKNQKIDERYNEILARSERYLVKNLANSDAENIYELALVTQALNSAGVNPETWDRKQKMKSILSHQDEEGSFRDMLATYYVMPLLSGKSLLSVGDHCDHNKNDSSSLDSLREAKMGVKYSLNFGPKNVTQSIFLSVLNDSTIYDVMRLAEKRNSNFRFSLDDKKKSGPLVYSIGGTPNDAEMGYFWNVEVTRNNRRYETAVTDIRTYRLQHEDTITFSLKLFQL